MKFANSLAISFALLSISYVSLSVADECNDFVKQLMLQQMKFVVPCITRLGLTKPEEKKEKVYCIMRCVLQDAQMLGKDGNVDFDLINKIVDGLPPIMKDKADKIFAECGHHAASLDPKEPNCDSYGPLLSCLTDLTGKLC